MLSLRLRVGSLHSLLNLFHAMESGELQNLEQSLLLGSFTKYAGWMFSGNKTWAEGLSQCHSKICNIYYLGLLFGIPSLMPLASTKDTLRGQAVSTLP